MEDLDIEEKEPVDSSSKEIENDHQAQDYDLEIDTKDKEGMVEGPKKALELLKGKKVRTLVIVVMVFILSLLLFSALSDSTKTNDFKYKESSCKNVTILYDPYGDEEDSSITMELEQYIKSAVYAYTKDMNITSGYHLYYALAIALRNEAITNDCQVTFRDKVLTTSVPENYDRDFAVDNSNGVTVVDANDNFVDVKVSDYCWSSYTEPDYLLYQANALAIPNDFADSYVNNEIFHDCECNKYREIEVVDEKDDDKCWTYWPNDIDDKTGEVINYNREYLHQDDETGFSVYGAYYLNIRQDKLYEDQLKYFLGRDIYFRTINKDEGKKKENKPSTNCSIFSLTDTTLSKEEFITSVKNFNSSKNDWPLFQNNAGLIYDMATSNGVNPEMVIVRSIREGFSPGGSTHNYFGINCNNKHPENCSKYATFEDGIMGFINILKKYDNFASFSGSYAYLGDYWYNPGGSGDGGCYYAKYIYPEGIDAYVEDACSSARRGCSGNNCLKTRPEDKNAYALYQEKEMAGTRFSIFGIREDACTNNTMNSGSCVIYNQSDPRWGGDYLGYSSSNTISRSGCALTSLAIALTCTGQIDNVEEFSPAVLNNLLKANSGFNGADIYWENLAYTLYVPKFKLIGRREFTVKTTVAEKIAFMNKVNEATNRIGIVHIQNAQHSRGHFVVLQSINETNNTITSLDPAGGKISAYSLMDIDGFKYYSY